MRDTSRGVVFAGHGRPLEVREFPLPQLAAGELLVKVDCATLCGSDLHTYEGRRQTPCPTILGHEIIGRVAALPPGEVPVDFTGRPLSLGDRITWSVAASCGDCFYCRRGMPQKCERLFKYGHERIDERHALSGGLAEHCHLARGTAVFCVPEALADEIACPANCATATVAAALRTAGEARDRVVLVQGAGMLGLTAAAMLREAGAREVIVADPDRRRLELAARFGATSAVQLQTDATDLEKVVEKATAGRGVDAALELSGAPEAVETAWPLLGIGARYVLVGAVFPNRDVALPTELVVRRLLRIEGVHNYTPADLGAAVDFLAAAAARYPFAELVTERFALADAETAFRHAVQTRAPRVAVLPSAP